MIRLTLRVRLTIWFAASLLIILAPVLAGVLALEYRTMRSALDHHLEEDLEVAAEMLVVRGDRLAWRTETTRDLGYDGGEQRWVEAYGLQGQPLYFRGLPRRGSIRAALPPPSVGSAGYQTVRTPAGAYTRLLAERRRFGDREAWVRVARSEDQFRSDLNTLLLIFLLVTPIAVVGAAVAGYVISGRALLPLVRMAERARSISADRLSERLPVETPEDEMGQLATVFNETFARLEASFARLKQFTADASHQLRTPLTAIRSVGEVGLREARDVADYQEIVGSMLEETDRLSRLVDTLLTLSRWESGRVPIRPGSFSLCGMAHEVAAQLSVLAEERRVSLTVADCEEPTDVWADPTMVRSAVLNVLDNAIKYSPEGGWVRVSWRPAPASFALVVDDNGPGIPVERRGEVFERFYRVDHQDAVGVAGSGLGLAIAHWAITANNGSIGIEEAAGVGARVALALPRIPPHERRPARSD